MATAPEFAFPPSARLLRSVEFEQVLRGADVRLRDGPLRLNAVFSRMHHARLGLIVGKKAIPRAHARNRVKRIVRNRFRCSRATLGSVDVVVQVIGPVTATQLHQHLDSLFRELESRYRAAAETGRLPGPPDFAGSLDRVDPMGERENSGEQ